MKKQLLFFIVACVSIITTSAQSTQQIIEDYLQDNVLKHEVTQDDIENIIIASDYITQKTGLQHIAIFQSYNGIPVNQSLSTVTLKNQKVIYFGNRLIANLSDKINTTSVAFTKEDAIAKAALGLNLSAPTNLQLIEDQALSSVFSTGGISLIDIPVALTFEAIDQNTLKLAYNISIQTTDGKHWWSVRVDAISGAIISQNDWILTCTFEGNTPHVHTNNKSKTVFNNTIFKQDQPIIGGAQYQVFPMPIESPSHGNDQVIGDPSNATASPFGWHDTDGNPGAEFTTTRGNNVWAQDDRNDDNTPNGISPDGGAPLNFSGYENDVSLNPLATTNLAITNLFYWNNLMHDIWYQYGFDEASGNFQENVYGNGGAGSDSVDAQAQDGNALNNANFGTGPDGVNPRMQMFLWSAPGNVGQPLTISAPASLAGSYQAAEPIYFGSGLTNTPITANIVIAVDSGGDVTDACQAITNTAQMAGNIALIRRGTCNFTLKVKNAQDAGAVAAIVVNNVANDPLVNMAGADNTVTIPSIFISSEDGDPIFSAINSSETVSAQLVSQPSQRIDGDFDNGIIAHEYGHGISTRLTGGPNVTNCLFNAEQMGEGWSDYFGLMLTIEPGDAGTDVRGIGTYVIDEPTTGNGIRPAPYSTNTAVNNFTYGDTNNTATISEPHGIGFVWATMIWDMTWDFIAEYGYDPDIYNGTGGNNMAMQLVIDGLKMQACSPGFVDGRDAIIAADAALNNGVNECLIRQAFADRGLGFSATQGDTAQRNDQVEAFDMPPIDQLDCTLSVNETIESSFKIYPNPAQNQVNITLNTTIYNSVEATLFDVQGRQVFTKIIDTSVNTTLLDVSSIQSGIYVLQIHADGKTFSEKLVIE